MTAGESRSAKGLRRAATATLLTLLLASCTSTSDPILELRAAAEQEVAADARTAKLSLAAEEDETASKAVAKAGEATPASTNTDDERSGAADQGEDDAKQKVAEDAQTADGKTKAAAASSSDPEDAAATEETEEAVEAKRRGFLSAFFSPARTQSAAAAIALKKQTEPAEKEAAAVEDEAKPLVDTKKSAKPLVKLASADAGDPEPMSAALTSMDALPGVRSGDQLFEITRKSGSDDTSDVDVYENTGSYRVASAAGVARMGAHGLMRQRPDVDVACLKPGLVRILHKIERHYGKKILVTSGYRSPAHNRAVNGAKHSQHMHCAAADIKVAGVSKWELARYVRALPGRGGVGTYCHTNAIHVDVGPERDWNWRCRRRGG